MTASWVDQPWLAIDTETTGIDVFADRIVEVAAVEITPDGTAGETYQTIVNPGIEIPDGAAAIHGITTARAREEGVDPAVALKEIAQRVFDHGHRPVVMFNARFDWPLLICEAERHDVDFPVFAPVLDPFLVDRMLDRFRRGSRKLVAVAQHYAVELDEVDAHGALADATAAALVMRAIIDRYPKVAEHSLASVYLRQVRGHEAWREEFVDWKHRNGDPSFDEPPGWPIPALIKGGLPVIEDATQGAGNDGPDSEGDARRTPDGQTSDTAAPGDGADGHDVGRTEPEPAPEISSPAHGEDDGAGEEGAVAGPASTSPASARGINERDVAKLANEVFKTDHDAAPRGQKTRTVDRLRWALIYAQTGGETSSLDGADGQLLLQIYNRLKDIAEGRLTYTVDDEAVTFTYAGRKPTKPIRWDQLQQEVAA